MWTPARFDLAVEFCGEVGDEDTSLTERAEVRAERFDGYSEKRAADASSIAAHVESIAGNIPFGQPIMIGHHSEKRARKDKEKIENGMRKAVKMWETSEYWTQRAAGALHHAKYKEAPRTRARRIKTLGAEMRSHERDSKEAANKLAMWSIEGLTIEKARIIAGYGNLKVGKHPRHDYGLSAYDVLREDAEFPMPLAEVVEIAKRVYPRTIAHCQRWIDHYMNRIAYETAMLNEQGAGELIEKKPRPKQAMIINRDGAITLKGRYRNPDETHGAPHKMTKAEYMAKREEYRGCLHTADGYRVRVALVVPEGQPSYSGRFVPVFLTDSKINKEA